MKLITEVLLELPLPNNDGSCDGTYSLQEGGKVLGNRRNKMGAAGTLKWIKVVLLELEDTMIKK